MTDIDKYIKDFHIEDFQNDLISWFQREQRQLPWRKDKDPYKVWVSEIMLQQTRVDTVIPYFHNFLDKFPTLEALAHANEQDVLKAWEGLGYYSRARNLQTAVKEVVEEYGGEVPSNKKELSKLKGVGPYTTGAILSIAFDVPEPAVDGNVMRVLSRILYVWEDIAKPKTRKLFEEIIYEIISKDLPSDFNQALMELGAIVCTPQSPSCLLCPVRDHCQAYYEGAQSELPVKSKNKKTKEVYLNAVILETEKGEFLIQKRPNEGLLANMWEFPNFEIKKDRSLHNPSEQINDFINKTYSIHVDEIKYLYEIKHVFSHLVWNIFVYSGKANSEFSNIENAVFIPKSHFNEYPFSVSHQKIISTIK